MSTSFEHFCSLLLEHSGLELNESKRYLVDNRLAPIVARLHLHNVDELLTQLQFGHDAALVTECVEALATHESSFFRDSLPFTQLENVIIPKLLQEKALSKSLRIWSAACSSGQEAYSIAMVLEEHAEELHDWHVEILATDMVAATIEQARKGFYTDFEVGRGLKPAQLQRWFKKVEGGYEVNPALRRHINFHPHNLLDPVIERGPFDIVFCRNVLIYFNRETKIELIKRIGAVLAHDGLLILGSAETVIGLCDTFESYAGQHGLFHRKIADPVY